MGQFGRRQFLIATAGFLGTPLARAQQAGRVYRIGVLGVTAPTPEVLKLSIEPFRQGLRERGWTEGRNILIEVRWAEGRNERLPELAAELVRLKVDVITTSLDDGVHAARKATQSIPIVASFMSERARLEVAQSYARPGGNVTGLTSEAGSMIVAKNLEILKDAVPSAKRIAVLLNPTSVQARNSMDEFLPIAKTLNVELRPAEAREPQEFEHAFARMKEDRAEALYVVGDGMFFLHRVRIAELALKHRLPTSCGLIGFAQAGCLINYVVDIADNWRRVATYVDKILKGANPADLPIEQPAKFQLILNLKTANALGLKIPQSVLLRATQVVE